MKTYLLIGSATDGKVICPNQKILDPKESTKSIKDFVNNNTIKSAILIEADDSATEVQLLKGVIADFSEALDKEMPDWQKTDDLVKISA